jgi:hypothetical protein
VVQHLLVPGLGDHRAEVDAGFEALDGVGVGVGERQQG